jgi:BlaI family penicillinase repressor
MEWSYSTIKTMLNRLVDKGFAEVDKTAANSFKYRAVVNEQDHKAQETRNFLQKVFNGSVSMMVSTLAKNSKLSKAELEELKRIVDKMEG